MTILFDATRPVKSAPRNFALGLTRVSSPRPRFEPGPSDLHWAAANLNEGTTCYEVMGISDEGLERIAENRRFDNAAGCALATARHEAGFRCF